MRGPLFVNPTQFAPGEDLPRSPRTRPRHARRPRRAARAGVDVVPRPPTRRAAGDAHGTYVEPPPECARAEGAAPGPLRGVATVGTAVWAARPTRAYFGQKDSLQAAVLRAVARELDEAARVVVVDRARETGSRSRAATCTSPTSSARPRSSCTPPPPRARAWRGHRSGGAAAGAGGALRDELVAAARAALTPSRS